MPPTTDYDILWGRTIEELKTKVKAAVANGWQVSGNMTFAAHELPYRRNHHFYQVMTRTVALISQINDKLGAISANVSAIKTNTDSIATSSASTASHTANIDSKTPTP